MVILNFKCFMVHFAFCTVLHVAICSTEKEEFPESRRVGDYLAPPGSGPYHASIQAPNGYHLCGSAIISDRHVVTAGHCVAGKNPEFFRLVVATTNLNIGGDYYYMEDYRVNEGYTHKVAQNDIAVVKIKGFFNPRNVQIIKLSEYELKTGDEVYVVGFGAPWSKGPTTRLMHYLYLPVINQQQCEASLRHYRPVTDRMFCTFTQYGQGTCDGDSGSPITINNELVGIVSWGVPCARGLPDVHTRINRYIPWIIQLLKY